MSEYMDIIQVNECCCHSKCFHCLACQNIWISYKWLIAAAIPSVVIVWHVRIYGYHTSDSLWLPSQVLQLSVQDLQFALCIGEAQVTSLSQVWIIVAAIPSAVIVWPCQNIWIPYKWIIAPAIPSVAVACAGLAVCTVHWGGTSDKLVTCEMNLTMAEIQASPNIVGHEQLRRVVWSLNITFGRTGQ